MRSLFCGKPETINPLFGEKCLIDSRIRYNYKDAKVTLVFELKEKNDEIGINFNYNKNLAEKEGAKEMVEYLLDNFEPMMIEADRVIRHLFGEPVGGDKTDDKSSDDNANR